MSHRDKHKAVFLCSLHLEKKKNIEHMCISFNMPNTACTIVT